MRRRTLRTCLTGAKSLGFWPQTFCATPGVTFGRLFSSRRHRARETQEVEVRSAENLDQAIVGRGDAHIGGLGRP